LIVVPRRLKDRLQLDSEEDCSTPTQDGTALPARLQYPDQVVHKNVFM
jgi:hypothetical protein